MWCEQCQSDVATEISADGQQLLCTTCHQPVRKVVAPSLHPETRSAREFLERWAREQQNARPAVEKPALDPQPVGRSEPDEERPFATPDSAIDDVRSPAIPPVSQTETQTPQREGGEPAKDGEQVENGEQAEAVAEAKKKYRIDPQHTAPTGPVPTQRGRPRRPHHLEEKPTAAAKESSDVPPASPPFTPSVAESSREPQFRLDEAQAGLQSPHFDVRSMEPQRTIFPGRSEAMWGQILAYAGVGLLTVGTIFVLWGYFGEIERYASTGWLVATAGQMLLLLGIVTLVGGGMQQTTHEVTQRIEHLGGRIIRIEESTDKILQTPYFHRTRRRTRKHRDGEQEAA